MIRFFSDIFRLVVATVIVYVASRPLDPPTDLTSWVPWGFLGFLVIGLGAALFRYRRPHARAAEALHQAAQELKRRRSAGDKVRAEVHEPGQRARDVDTAPPSVDQDSLPEAFKNHRPLRASWNGLCAVRHGTKVGSPSPGTSAVSPSEHFTVAGVLGRNLGSLPNALPGVFTAVGLLGTFVGIAMGLADIEPTAAAENLMEGIRTLMSGMSTAFVTSIVGITFSVWWLFEFRIAEGRFRSRLDLFIGETARVFRVEEPHETLMRVAISNESVGRSADAIKDTADKIKGDVQSLGDDLYSTLEPLFKEHVAEPIRNLNTDLGKRQTEALGRMVEAFRDTLVSSVEEELSEFGQALRAASDHQANAARELEGFFARLTEVSEVQVKLLARTTEVATVFDRGLAALAEATEAIEGAGESARDTMAAAREAMDIARGLTEESRRQLEVQEELSEAARRSWDGQASLLEGMQANLDRLATDLGDKIVEFRTASAQKISEVFHVFDSEMAKVVERLGGTLAELRDVTEELPGAVASLQDTTRDLADAGRDQRDSLAKGLRAFEEAKAKLAGKLEQTREDLRGLGRALPAFAKDIGLRQSEFAKATDNLQSGIEAMVDRMEVAGTRWEEDFKRLAERMDAGAGRVEEVASSVAGSMAPVGKWTEKATERLDLLSEQAEALTRALSGLQVTVNPPPQRMGIGGANTKAPAPPTPMPNRAREDTERPQVLRPPPTKRTDDTKTAPRTGIDMGSRRDGHHDDVEPTEPPRGILRRFFGRRK